MKVPLWLGRLCFVVRHVYMVSRAGVEFRCCAGLGWVGRVVVVLGTEQSLRVVLGWNRIYVL